MAAQFCDVCFTPRKQTSSVYEYTAKSTDIHKGERRRDSSRPMNALRWVNITQAEKMCDGTRKPCGIFHQKQSNDYSQGEKQGQSDQGHDGLPQIIVGRFYVGHRCIPVPGEALFRWPEAPRAGVWAVVRETARPWVQVNRAAISRHGVIAQSSLDLTASLDFRRVILRRPITAPSDKPRVAAPWDLRQSAHGILDRY